jgi:lysophospholipase L1-like esterase
MRPPLRQRLWSHFAILGFWIVSLLVMGVLIELVSWGAWLAFRERTVKPKLGIRSSPVFVGESWAPEYWKEESSMHEVHTPYVPFRIWGVVGWHGKYISNDETEMGILRRTINPTRQACTAQNTTSIWMFGGSALYGTGVPDWATLPSYLSRDLNARSSACVIISNFGVEGYVTNQELIVLIEQLKAGRHPNIVVFYDGVNDSGAAVDSSTGPVPHFLFAEVKSRVENSTASKFDFIQQTHTVRVLAAIMRRLHWRHSRTISAETSHRKAVAVLDNYEANMQLVKMLGRAYNFALHRFWQPSLYYGHKPLVPFEQEKVDASNPGTDMWSPEVKAGYEEAKARAARSGAFVFLGDLFNLVGDPLYVDMVHLGPEGNQLVAQTLARYIEEGEPR